MLSSLLLLMAFVMGPVMGDLQEEELFVNLQDVLQKLLQPRPRLNIVIEQEVRVQVSKCCAKDPSIYGCCSQFVCCSLDLECCNMEGPQ